MQNRDPLIRTKLRLPFIRPGLVSRPRLQEQIAHGLCGPLTLITAPAGFGKTTLVAACVSGCGMPVAWLSLDKDDNQEGRFLTYLINALQGADARIGRGAVQLMTGLQPAPGEIVLTSLINDLDATSREMVLVLDDYQFISSQSVHAEMMFLLEHCPQTLHVLIATRSDPPLSLARLRARSQMLELRAADLRFTPSEAAQFLNEVMGLHLDAGLVAMLDDRTEGWIAGLQMAALSMRDRGDARGFVEGFSGTNRHILDYLLEEILASQSTEIQHFLLSTSILERFTAPLCDALLKNDQQLEPGEDHGKSQLRSPTLRPSASVLEYLERENIFLVSLDDERIWFRYHHLFADLLRARLHLTQPNRIPDLHIRASAWLEQKGFIPEAIHHLCAAQEHSRAADLIERYGPARFADSDPSVLLMADNLPPEMLIDRPKIGFYQAWLLILLGHIGKALPLLNDLARQLASEDSDSTQQWIQAMVTLALAFLGQRTGTGGQIPLPADQVLDKIPADESILRDVADMLYAMTLGRRGDIDRAAEVSVRCIQREKTHPGALAAPSLFQFLARIYLMQGRLRAAASLCREFLDPIRQKGARFMYSAGSMNIILGEVLCEWNLLEEAEQQIRDGLRANEPWVDIMTDAFGQLALVRVLQAKGSFTEALQAVEVFETRLPGGHFRPYEFEEDFHTLRVRVQLASGDLQSASQWADQVQYSEDFHLHEERYWLTLARIHLAQGRYADVEKILSGIAPPMGASNRITRKIEYNLLLAAAIAEQAGGRRMGEAARLMEACLILAEPEGNIRAFLDMGEPARDLLIAYLRTTDPGHKLFAQKLLDAFAPSSGASFPGPQQPAGLIEPLTERELEVLQLIAQGKTNLEIASQLIVARGTVKAHAANIFSKLEVTNRTEAVARARQIGILP
jgi:LuxR family transcriptional regulator, maltose regulon positive regulatory protein